ncbi:CPBP family intramembrane metalloprotease [bacterium]|jgi:membrane protease YdiL (CAAX protease family)|nr:CPBP family intramembrane metalloprotease [bacterium]MBT4251084.1 CPBP family intramembrane metalloprotease [bacterium]MBT4597926.1 CPBP family intramembrane metalloprotease [bacterium]MBT6753883.1 CPBP family intramembrane metalloprotease [bacterium]MBT7037312.1 CPBP family intramembrane metalloprotease [bacterium]
MKIKKSSKKDRFLLLVTLVNLVLVIFLTNLFLEDVRAGGVLEWMVISIFFLFVSPLFIIKKIFEEKPKDYFLQISLNVKDVIFSLWMIVIFIAVTSVFVVKLDWQDSLRVSSWVIAKDVKLMLFVNLLIVPIVVFSKEFFFRGFVMKRLMPIVGVAGAIVTQALLFLVYELGTGGMISWKSMVLILIPNLCFGIIAYKNKSILISTILHWVYLLTIDIYFYYQFILS